MFIDVGPYSEAIFHLSQVQHITNSSVSCSLVYESTTQITFSLNHDHYMSKINISLKEDDYSKHWTCCPLTMLLRRKGGKVCQNHKASSPAEGGEVFKKLSGI